LPRSSALGPDFDAPGSIGAAVDGGDGLLGLAICSAISVLRQGSGADGHEHSDKSKMFHYVIFLRGCTVTKDVRTFTFRAS
jgi:hypothetical protein